MLADDVILQAASINNLQQTLTVAAVSAKQNKMSWGIKTLTVLSPTELIDSTRVVAGQTVSNERTATYLGMTAIANGLGVEAGLKRIEKARNRFRVLCSCGIHTGKVPSSTVPAICHGCVFLTAIYGLHHRPKKPKTGSGVD